MSDEQNPEGESSDGLGHLTLADGPWSKTDAPQDAEFTEFGPLLVPAAPGLQARLEIDPQHGEVGAVTIRVADCAVQLQVIAKRPGMSVWTDTRQQLLANLRRRAGFQQVVEGRFGAEVIATITGRTTEGGLVDAVMRFQGIEGDRWMIRAASSGPSVTADAVVARIDALLSRCAVDVSAANLATDDPEPGTVLPLGTPPGEMDIEALKAEAAAAAEAGDAGDVPDAGAPEGDASPERDAAVGDDA